MVNVYHHMVITLLEIPGKSWNLTFVLEPPWKSWNFNIFWKCPRMPWDFVQVFTKKFLFMNEIISWLHCKFPPYFFHTHSILSKGNSNLKLKFFSVWFFKLSLMLSRRSFMESQGQLEKIMNRIEMVGSNFGKMGLSVEIRSVSEIS